LPGSERRDGETPRGVRRFVLTDRVVWWTSFAVLAVFGVAWSLSIALMGSPDEPAHTRKAVAVVRGELDATVHFEGAPDEIRVPLTFVRVPTEYRFLDQLRRCWNSKASVPVSCAPSPHDLPGTAVAGTTAGAYPPAYYALVGWPSRFLSVRAALYSMRIVSALLCAALFASGLVSARKASSGPLIFAGAALAITPTTLFLGSSINPNGAEIAAAFCVWTSLLAVCASPAAVSRRLLLRLTVASVLLVSLRTLSPGFFVAIVALVLFAAADRATLVTLWRQPLVRASIAVIGVVFVVATAYVVVNRSYDAVIAFPGLDLSRGEIIRASWDRMGRRFMQAIGLLSWGGFGEFGLEPWLVDAWLVATATLVAVALVVGRWRARAAVAAAAAAFYVLAIVSDVLTVPDKNFLWSGRYALPLAIGAPILAGWVADRSGRIPRRVSFVAATVVCIGVGFAHVAGHERLMTRNLVGLPNGVYDGLRRARWHGPLAPAPLVALFVVAACVFAAWLLVLGLRPRTHEASVSSAASSPELAPADA
jgi:predicted membrane protein DUF2142